MTGLWAKQTNIRLRQTKSGFTIVELLIVIVIIAILAVITVVAYSNIQARANFSRSQSDLKSIVKALELYKIDHGGYPITDDLPGCTYDWCGWNQATGNSFIPGLAPQYISTIPQLPSELPSGDTYLYQGRANGHYQLIRYKSDVLHPVERQSDNPLLAMTDSYDGLYAWGYRTNTDAWW